MVSVPSFLTEASPVDWLRRVTVANCAFAGIALAVEGSPVTASAAMAETARPRLMLPLRVILVPSECSDVNGAVARRRVAEPPDGGPTPVAQ
ncbi:hypothetical protein GCM10023226_43410 [Nocardioides nanhaiensis]|uniref:Uncharacterized protein n=1 Tax=Nocardioides nanhaiensis TaxID=1476871 RepID=A0ABP8X3R0_9ACTN